MNKVTLGNIAGPALNRAGAAGRDILPALIGRIIAVGALVASVAHSTGSGQAAVRVNHSKSGTELIASVKHPTSIREASDGLGRSGVCIRLRQGYGGQATDALQPILERVAGKGGC